MKTLMTFAAGCLALLGVPAHADHGYRAYHRSHAYVRPYVRPYLGFGFGYGYPRRYYYGYPWSTFGLRLDLGRHRAPRNRDDRERDEGRPSKLYVYPAAGQSEEQTNQDRYECHVWAVDHSGFDPTLGAGKAQEMDSYQRAFVACLEGRDYVVK
jgi:hypothetical protein